MSKLSDLNHTLLDNSSPSPLPSLKPLSSLSLSFLSSRCGQFSSFPLGDSGDFFVFCAVHCWVGIRHSLPSSIANLETCPLFKNCAELSVSLWLVGLVWSFPLKQSEMLQNMHLSQVDSNVTGILENRGASLKHVKLFWEAGICWERCVCCLSGVLSSWLQVLSHVFSILFVINFSFFCFCFMWSGF